LESTFITESNQNSKDIIVLKLNNAGILDSYFSISNGTDEKIEQIRAVNDELVLGITSYGYEYARDLGARTFLQFDTLSSRGIATYIKMNEMIGFAQNRNNPFDTPNSYSIIPNPATDFVTIISNESSTQIEEVRITDISGKLVYSENHINRFSMRVDVSTLLSGVYTITIKDENKSTFNQKIIIAR